MRDPDRRPKRAYNGEAGRWQIEGVSKSVIAARGGSDPRTKRSC